MRIDERTVGGVKILDVSGSIKFTQGDEILKDKVHSIVHQGTKNVLVNLAAVDYVDSAGLGELVGAYTTVAKAGGKMKLINVTKKMRDLLVITKLITVFDTFEDEQQGIKSFS